MVVLKVVCITRKRTGLVMRRVTEIVETGVKCSYGLLREYNGEGLVRELVCIESGLYCE